MKFVYFCDPMGDVLKEVQEIRDEINILSGHLIDIIHSNTDPLSLGNFDVLFFDWGGMSIGNSFIEKYSRYILRHAKEHPSKFYVMTSRFTQNAMKDAIASFGSEKPANILLEIKDLIPYLATVSAGSAP